MRWINKIIVHCSDSPFGRNDKAKDIDLWHKAKGWSGIGYHFVIDLDGTIEKGRDVRKIGAHCLTQNNHSIGVCYIGGRDRDGKYADTRTPAQRESMAKLLRELVQEYKSPVYGHRDFANKPCPCFDAKAEYRYLYDELK